MICNKELLPALLFIRNESLDRLVVGHIGHNGLTEISFALGAFLAEDVGLIRVAADNLPGFGQLKAFFCTAMSFELGHCKFLLRFLPRPDKASLTAKLFFSPQKDKQPLHRPGGQTAARCGSSNGSIPKSLLLGRLCRKKHQHMTAFHFCGFLNFGEFGASLGEPAHDLVPDFRMPEFPASEADGHLDLIAFL